MSEIRMTEEAYEQMVGHCFDAYPLEGCGLIATDPGGAVSKIWGLTNAAESARIYELDSEEFIAADRDADELGLVIAGVFHSHTHTDAYPSPTDVAKAPIPDWHYVLVSFADGDPKVRSFRIVEGQVEEEPVVPA